MATTDKNKRSIEIADFMFANPLSDRADIFAKYGKKWQLSVRTMDRIISEAKAINNERIAIQEKAKSKVIEASAGKHTERAILNRDEAAEILSKIAQGEVRDIKDEDGKLLESLVSTDSDRIRAIQQLSKMSGWDAPQKVAQTDSQGNDVGQPLTPERRKEILKEAGLCK